MLYGFHSSSIEDLLLRFAVQLGFGVPKKMPA